ncbi:MAG: CpaF family protein [Phycisphaerales bacterium]|nr:CpaF family protein [Phycisphaerales bacterium]
MFRGSGSPKQPSKSTTPVSEGGKPSEQPPPGKPSEPVRRDLDAIKTRIHRKLLDRLDLSQVVDHDNAESREEIKALVAALCDEEDVLLDQADRKRIVTEVLDQTFGLGPLEEILADPNVSDILVNGPKQIYIEKGGRLTLSTVVFKDNAHVLHVLDKIVSAVGRRVDEVNPMVDARLADGSRVNAIIPPLALDGPSISIRRFGKDPVTWENYITWESCPPELVDLLEACVVGRLNVLIIGGTGSGKTTLLNNCSSFIPATERIVTIEDAAELRLRQPHIVRLETRPANIEGKGRISIRELLINSLRMRPDRIVVGECRGGETLDMLQAMNTGHDGSLTTVHANSARDAVQRIETMVMMAGFDLPVRAIRSQFASAVNLIVHASRLTGGPRKILSVTEVMGMEGDVVTMQQILGFEQQGIGPDGKAFGRFTMEGVRPSFVERVKAHGGSIGDISFDRRVLQTGPAAMEQWKRKKGS